MASWITWWLIFALVSVMLVGVCLAFLARHLILLGRAAKQLQAEVQPLTEEINREGQRASGRAGSLRVPKPRSTRS